MDNNGHFSGLASSAVPSAPPVSLCMIVKNEERNLPACLATVRDLVSETIVVDTGSSDRTREEARRLGARVFDFPWIDSFAAARNESLRHARCPWIFWMDADDRLDETNRERLRALFATLGDLGDENAAYSMKCVCVTQHGQITVVDHVRLFRNHPRLRWTYRVHEQTLPAIRRLGHELRWSEVEIQHTGYQDRALRRRKLERDLRLLRLEDMEEPDHPFTLFNMGSIAQELGRTAEAVGLYRRCLARSHPADSIVRKVYALLAQSLRHLGLAAEAGAVCREGRRYYPDDAEILFHDALNRMEGEDLTGAEECLVRLLEGNEGAHFASTDTGVRGHKGRYHLATVYRRQGREEEAEGQLRRAVEECPGFTPAWEALAEICKAQGRGTDLENVTRQMVLVKER
jgi:glycosyltransferase involved in cell wall biosynthesis